MISIKVLRENHKIDPGMCQVPWSSAKPDLKSEQQEISTAAGTEHKEETERTESTESTERTESTESAESAESTESTENTNQITQPADNEAQQKENPDPELGKDLGKERHEEEGTEQSKDQKEEMTQKFGLGINII